MACIIGGREKSIALAAHYKALANFMEVSFFDAGSCVTTDGVDGVHFTLDNHSDLGKALAVQVKEVLGPEATT